MMDDRDDLLTEHEHVRRKARLDDLRQVDLEQIEGIPRDVVLEQAPALALREAREAIQWLTAHPSFCDAEYTHYTRQIDFVELDGQRVVSDVFLLEDIADMAVALEAACGFRLDAERRENANFASSNPILSILHVAKPIYSRLTPWSFREKVVVALRRMKLHGPEALYARLRREPEISEFVEDYYAQDLALYRSLKDQTVGRNESRNKTYAAA